MANLSDGWAVFSPISGSTHILNEESAAVLECFDSVAAFAPEDMYAQLAKMYGQDAESIAAAAGPVWQQLVSAGLIREQDVANVR